MRTPFRSELSDNSCASSVCGSPRAESKRQLHPSRRNLTAITEDDPKPNGAEASPADQRPTDDAPEKSDDSCAETGAGNDHRLGAEDVERGVKRTVSSVVLPRYIVSPKYVSTDARYKGNYSRRQYFLNSLYHI